MLLQQYEAVSFGDATFGCYVLLPMQQQQSRRLRAAVWTEYSAVLRALTVPLKQVRDKFQFFLADLQKYILTHASTLSHCGDRFHADNTGRTWNFLSDNFYKNSPHVVPNDTKLCSISLVGLWKCGCYLGAGIDTTLPGAG